jgi:phosphatidate cytidylyltransferase
MDKMNNLLTRSITGLIFAVSIIGSILISRYAFCALFLVFTILGLLEFYSLFSNETVKPQKYSGIIIGIILYLIIFFSPVDINSMFNIILLIPLLFPLFIAELFRKKEQPFANIAYTILGIIYIAVPFGILNLFYSHAPMQNGQTLSSSILNSQFSILIMFFGIIWIYDTFAYFTGSLIEA